MDRRWNDLNALRQAREHLKEIERLEERNKELAWEIQEAKKECNRNYTETKRKDFPTNREKEYYELLNYQWQRKQKEKREKNEKLRKKLMIFLSVGIFIFYVLVSESKGGGPAFEVLFWGYPALFIINLIMKRVTNWTCGCAYKLTKDDQKKLAQYAEQDARNAEEYKNYVQRMNQQAPQHAREVEKRNRPKIADTERKIYENYQALQRLDILGRNEQNLSAVNALIDIMESHRADSIPEALRVYDAQRHYHNQVVQAQFNERMNILEQKWQRQEQFDRDMAAAAHRREVEALLQKQLDALEQD